MAHGKAEADDNTAVDIALNDSAAASIPAALNLIVHIFPGEIEQHVALACFGGAGELANVSGFILGGVLLLASWRWVFWLLPIVCFPMALVTFFLIPSRKHLKMYQLAGLRREILEGSERAEKILKALEASEMSNKFDFVGTFLIVAAAVLSIFGLTDGGESAGWQVDLSLLPIYLRPELILRFPAHFIGPELNRSSASSSGSSSSPCSSCGNVESINGSP